MWHMFTHSKRTAIALHPLVSTHVHARIPTCAHTCLCTCAYAHVCTNVYIQEGARSQSPSASHSNRLAKKRRSPHKSVSMLHAYTHAYTGPSAHAYTNLYALMPTQMFIHTPMHSSRLASKVGRSPAHGLSADCHFSATANAEGL